jgi:predicted transcriptional regulator
MSQRIPQLTSFDMEVLAFIVKAYKDTRESVSEVAIANQFIMSYNSSVFHSTLKTSLTSLGVTGLVKEYYGPVNSYKPTGKAQPFLDDWNTNKAERHSAKKHESKQELIAIIGVVLTVVGIVASIVVSLLKP